MSFNAVNTLISRTCCCNPLHIYTQTCPYLFISEFFIIAMTDEGSGGVQIGDRMREMTLSFGRALKAKSTVIHRRKQSSTEALQHMNDNFTDSPAPSQPRMEVTDSYGFIVSVTHTQQSAISACLLKESKQLVKWHECCTPPSVLPPEDRLKKLCRKGIPPQLRKWIWTEVSGANKRRNSHPVDYYTCSIESAQQASPWTHQIELDVPRTFPSCQWVQSDAGQSSIRRVLFAFAHHNPVVGYCQGMNYLTALLLIVLEYDEESAFWVLASLIDNDRGILYQGMYAKDLSGCHVEMRSLRELVKLKLPRLAHHLEVLHCDMSLLATDWFLCLFCTSLPAETAIRVWDALLQEGPKVLFRVALALLKMSEPLLLTTDNPGDLLRCVRNAAANEFDRDELMRVAFDGVGSLPMERIKQYRDSNQKKVDKEMAAREMRANLRAAVKKGYVLTEAEAELLKEPEGIDGDDDDDDGAQRHGIVPSFLSYSGMMRLGSALGEKTKATLEAGKERIRSLPHSNS